MERKHLASNKVLDNCGFSNEEFFETLTGRINALTWEGLSSVGSKEGISLLSENFYKPNRIYT